MSELVKSISSYVQWLIFRLPAEMWLVDVPTTINGKKKLKWKRTKMFTLKCRNVPEYDMLPTNMLQGDYCTDSSSSCWPSDGQKRPRSADPLQTQLVCFRGCRRAPCWVSGRLVERFSYFGPKMFPVGATAPLCVQGEELIHTHTHTCFTNFVRTFSGINAFLSLLCSRLITTCTHVVIKREQRLFFFLITKTSGSLVCTKSGCIQRKPCCRSLKVAATTQLVTEIWTQALFFLLL